MISKSKYFSIYNDFKNLLKEKKGVTYNEKIIRNIDLSTITFIIEGLGLDSLTSYLNQTDETGELKFNKSELIDLFFQEIGLEIFKQYIYFLYISNYNRDYFTDLLKYILKDLNVKGNISNLSYRINSIFEALSYDSASEVGHVLFRDKRNISNPITTIFSNYADNDKTYSRYKKCYTDFCEKNKERF